MGTNTSGEKTIKSTQTAFDIIETIAEQDQPTISEIASITGHSRSTIHYHLNTMRQNRYVVRGDKGFRLGLQVARIGNLARQHHVLTGIVEEPVDSLAEETDTIAQVVVEEGGKAITLYHSVVKDLDEVSPVVGTETDIHCTAYGQAILAHLSPTMREEIIETHGLSAHTPQTITDEQWLTERLETVRKLGFAYSAEERIDGISSIAVPIITESNTEVIGAVGVTARDDRIDEPNKHVKARRFSDELPGMIQRTAQIISDRVTGF